MKRSKEERSKGEGGTRQVCAGVVVVWVKGESQLQVKGRKRGKTTDLDIPHVVLSILIPKVVLKPHEQALMDPSQVEALPLTLEGGMPESAYSGLVED